MVFGVIFVYPDMSELQHLILSLAPEVSNADVDTDDFEAGRLGDLFT